MHKNLSLPYCKLLVLQIACVANSKCCKLKVLQIAIAANCKCCKWQVLLPPCKGPKVEKCKDDRKKIRGQASKQTNGQTDGVTSSLLKLLVAAKNIYVLEFPCRLY